MPINLVGDRIVNGMTIRSLHVPPIGKTKFHELVHEGKVVRAPTGKGRYLLYATCRNLGLEVPAELGLEVPAELDAAVGRPRQDVMRWAFSMIDPKIFPTPGWAIGGESFPEYSRAKLYAQYLEPTVMKLGPAPKKLAFLAGLIDALDDGVAIVDDQTMRSRLEIGPVEISIEDLEDWLQAGHSAKLETPE